MPLTYKDTSGAPTPNRKIHVILDADYAEDLVEEGFWFHRTGPSILETAKDNRNAFESIVDYGIRPKALNRYPSADEELGLIAPLLPSTGAMLVADGFAERQIIKNITSGEYQDVHDVGSEPPPVIKRYLQKVIPAGESWKKRLEADETSFPGVARDVYYNNPTVLRFLYHMDRVGITTELDQADKAIYFSIGYEWWGNKVEGHVATIYFSAPATNNSVRGLGSGIYALLIFGSGKMELYERPSNYTPGQIWYPRTTFTFRRADDGRARRVLYVRILKGYTDKNNLDGYIEIEAAEGDASYRISESGVDQTNSPRAQMILNSVYGRGSMVYHAKDYTGLSATTLPVQLIHNRIDLRRSGKWLWIFGTPTELDQEPVTLEDVEIVYPYFPTSRGEIQLKWNADVPVGTTLDLKLYNARTRAELTVASSGDKYKYYTAQFPDNVFYVVATWTSTSNRKATLKSYSVSSDAHTADNSTTEVEIEARYMMSVDIDHSNRNVDANSATFSFVDLDGTFDFLQDRSGMAVRIETEYDAADPTKRVVLFKGVVEKATFIPRYHSGKGGLAANTPKSHPNQSWGVYRVLCNGEWYRLKQKATTIMYNFWDYTEDKPMKLTDMFQYMFTSMGVVPARIDIEDNPIRPGGKENNKSWFIEPWSNFIEVMQMCLDFYLKGFLFYDATVDKWRYNNPPVSPYTALARFYTRPTFTRLALSTSLNALDQSTPSAIIEKGSVQSFVIKPEFNTLTVRTNHNVDGEGNAAGTFEVTVVNPKSYNFHPSVDTADVTSPDYLGYVKRAWVQFDTLAVDGNPKLIKNRMGFVARRLMDIGGRGYRVMSFDAPLIFVTHEDDATKKRPLRYYDPITIDGTTYLIRSVSFNWTKDHKQMAHYEVEIPNEPL